MRRIDGKAAAAAVLDLHHRRAGHQRPQPDRLPVRPRRRDQRLDHEPRRLEPAPGHGRAGAGGRLRRQRRRHRHRLRRRRRRQAHGHRRRQPAGRHRRRLTSSTGPRSRPTARRWSSARRDAAGVDQGYWRLPLLSGRGPQADAGRRRARAGRRGRRRLRPPGPGRRLPLVAADGLLERRPDRAGRPRRRRRDPAGGHGRRDRSDPAGHDGQLAPDLERQSTRPSTSSPRPTRALTWSYWSVTTAGVATRVGPAAGGHGRRTSRAAWPTSSRAADGSTHLNYVAAAGGRSSRCSPADPIWSEASPSFSPDGSAIVFSRVGAHNPSVSGGIWIVKPDGSGLTNLSTDGAFPRWLP